LKKEIAADKIAERMTPAKIKLAGERRPCLSEARRITKTKVMAEKIKAPAVGAREDDKKRICGNRSERMITAEAPKAAPEETPKV
jgi:hypothetical protein